MFKTPWWSRRCEFRIVLFKFQAFPWGWDSRLIHDGRIGKVGSTSRQDWEEGWSDMLRYVKIVIFSMISLMISHIIQFLFVFFWGDPFGNVIRNCSMNNLASKTLDIAGCWNPWRWLSHAFCSLKSFAGRNFWAVGSFGAVRRPPWRSYFVNDWILWILSLCDLSLFHKKFRVIVYMSWNLKI